jgi:hypothetical protein
MSRTPLIRRVAAIVVAVAIPLAAGAPAQANTPPGAQATGQAHRGLGFTIHEPNRSSWS